MILTGKANKDYEVWLYENHTNYWRLAWGKLPESAQMAMIIEWLDSVGIYISLYHHPISLGVSYNINIHERRIYGKVSGNRQEATKQAIIKANELYNGRE